MTNFILDNNKLIDKSRKGDNYKVINLNNDSEVCICFFSSNGLYKLNTEEEFRKVIIETDKYEWDNLSRHPIVQKSASRLIFFRDVKKSYYLDGISEQYNSIDKVIELTKELTKGYEIITVGSSAGAYMAAIVGSALDAKLSICFSGIFSLYEWADDANIVYQRGINKLEYNKWYDIRGYLKESVPIVYLYPGKSRDDVKQSALIKGFNMVLSVGFDESIHGKTIYSENIPWLFNNDIKKIEILVERNGNHLINKNYFFIKTMGLLPWICLIKKKLLKRYGL